MLKQTGSVLHYPCLHKTCTLPSLLLQVLLHLQPATDNNVFPALHPPALPRFAGSHDSGTFDLSDSIDGSYKNSCPVDPSSQPDDNPLTDAIKKVLTKVERDWSIAQTLDLPSQVQAGRYDR